MAITYTEMSHPPFGLLSPVGFLAGKSEVAEVVLVTECIDLLR
jgi:hypothetical protein